MATISCDICGSSLSMDASGEFAVCDSCGLRHTKDRMKAIAQEVIGTVTISNIPGIEPLMMRGKQFLEGSDWKRASEYFDRVLDSDPEYAPAYIGMLCAELNVTKEANLVKRPALIVSLYYQKALRFAKEDYLAKIQAYNRFQSNKKNKLRLENILMKIAPKSDDDHTATLQEDGTVIATGKNVEKIQVQIYKNLSSMDWEWVWMDDGDYTGGRWSNTKGQQAGKGPCDTNGWCDIIALAVGDRHTVGLKKNGVVVAVGLNRTLEYYKNQWDARGMSCTMTSSKQTGIYKGGTCETAKWESIVAIAAGSYHTVGLRKDGRVLACGRNGSMQCDTESWRDIVMIAASDNYTIGLRGDGTIVATGYFNSKINYWRDIVAISANGVNYLGVKSDGKIVFIRGGVEVAGSEEQIIHKIKEEERLDQERRDEEKRNEAEWELQEAEHKLSEQYNELIQKMNKASTEKDYQYLAEQFETLFFMDSMGLASKCNSKYRTLKRLREEAVLYEENYRERKRWTIQIFSTVSGMVIGGLIFALLNPICHNYDAVMIGLIAVGGGGCMVIGCLMWLIGMANYVSARYRLWYIRLMIGPLLVGGPLIALGTTTLITSIVLGVILGALIGIIIGAKIKKKIS